MSSDANASEGNSGVFDPHPPRNDRPASLSGLAAAKGYLPLRIIRAIGSLLGKAIRAVLAFLRTLGGRDEDLEPNLHCKGNAYGGIFDQRIAALKPPQPVPPPDYSKQQLRGVTLVLVALVFLIAVGAMSMLAISQREPVVIPHKTDQRGDRQRAAPEDLATKRLLLEAATKRKDLTPGLDAQVRQALEKMNNAPDAQERELARMRELLRKAEQEP